MLSGSNSLLYSSTKDGEVSFILRPPFGGLYSSLYTSSVIASSSKSRDEGQERGYGEGIVVADIAEKIQTIYNWWLSTTYTADT